MQLGEDALCTNGVDNKGYVNKRTKLQMKQGIPKQKQPFPYKELTVKVSFDQSPRKN